MGCLVSTNPVVDTCFACSAIRRSLRQSPFSGRRSSPSAYPETGHYQTAKLRRGVQTFRATGWSAHGRQITTILQQVLSAERPINPPTRSALLTANWRGCGGSAESGLHRYMPVRIQQSVPGRLQLAKRCLSVRWDDASDLCTDVYRMQYGLQPTVAELPGAVPLAL